MLAPRTRLWSTPDAAIDAAVRLAELRGGDVVYDVGCGDGRVLIRMASSSSAAASDDRPVGGHHHRCREFVGIEISEGRAHEARRNVERARASGAIPPHVSVTVVCANALDCETCVDWSRATVVFLYLVPRGLRLVKPLVWPTPTTTAAAAAAAAAASEAPEEQEGGGEERKDEGVGDCGANCREEGGGMAGDGASGTMAMPARSGQPRSSSPQPPPPSNDVRDDHGGEGEDAGMATTTTTAMMAASTASTTSSGTSDERPARPRDDGGTSSRTEKTMASTTRSETSVVGDDDDDDSANDDDDDDESGSNEQPTTKSGRGGGGRTTRRIITYMSPFADTPHVRKEHCAVDHQEGASWPVYLYHCPMD